MNPLLRSLARAAALLGSLAAASPALAQAGGSLAACRAIGDAAQRLACYDALPLSAPTPSPAPVAPAAATPAAAPAAAAQPAPVARFGLEQRATPDRAEAIDSRIEGRFTGWGPKQRIRLANGQVWQITDGSSATMNVDHPQVRVRRGMMGAFYLEIEGTNRSPRVTRLE